MTLQRAAEHQFLDDRLHDEERNQRHQRAAWTHAIAGHEAERHPDGHRSQHCDHKVRVTQPVPASVKGSRDPLGLALAVCRRTVSYGGHGTFPKLEAGRFDDGRRRSNEPFLASPEGQ